jgi:hypothetical protein
MVVSINFAAWVAKSIADGSLPSVLCVFPNGGLSGYRGEVEHMIIEELIPAIENEVLILPDTKHNLGLYYERSVSKLLAFLGSHLEK